MYDLVIRGATVVDGLGHDPVRADVAVKDGRIAAVGALGTDAAEIVDAEKMLRRRAGTAPVDDQVQILGARIVRREQRRKERHQDEARNEDETDDRTGVVAQPPEGVRPETALALERQLPRLDLGDGQRPTSLQAGCGD